MEGVELDELAAAAVGGHYCHFGRVIDKLECMRRCKTSRLDIDGVGGLAPDVRQDQPHQHPNEHQKVVYEMHQPPQRPALDLLVGEAGDVKAEDCD